MTVVPSPRTVILVSVQCSSLLLPCSIVPSQLFCPITVTPCFITMLTFPPQWPLSHQDGPLTHHSLNPISLTINSCHITVVPVSSQYSSIILSLHHHRAPWYHHNDPPSHKNTSVSFHSASFTITACHCPIISLTVSQQYTTITSQFLVPLQW